jgi:hypothetical protein
MRRLKHLWLRFKYRKQLKAGYGLLQDQGAKKNFVLMNDRLFIMNGVDPLVRVDCTTGKAEQYENEYKPTYRFTVYNADNESLSNVK